MRWSLKRQPNTWYRYLLHQANGQANDPAMFTTVPPDNSLEEPTLISTLGGFQVVQLSPGIYSFYVTAVGGSGESDPSNFVTVTVRGINTIPGTIIPDTIDIAASREGNSISGSTSGVNIDLGAHNHSSKPITFELLSAPDGMHIDMDNGSINWMPPAQGKYPVVVMASYKDQPDIGTIGKFIVDVNSSVAGVPVPVNGIEKFRAYPNPSSSNVHVEFPAAAVGTRIALSDLLGNTILSSGLAGGTRSFDLNTASLAAGEYFISIVGSNATSTIPLTVRR
ncbi:MAG: T9SS type A sorting domain-containing protein [Candidatus Kapaibacterium sp.]